MRAWKKGAVIGGTIGLLMVSDFIFYPIIGAIIGAVLFHAVQTLVTSNMKLWKKTGIVGGVWGLISGIYWFGLSFALTMGHSPVEQSTLTFAKTIFSPGYVTFLIALRIKTNIVSMLQPALRLILFFSPGIIFGFSIGALSGYLYEKIRDQEFEGR